jgi:hypothetical protein
MHYDLQKDAMRGNWWVVKQDDEGHRKVIYTLSHKLTYTEAKERFEVLVQQELQNDS